MSKSPRRRKSDSDKHANLAGYNASRAPLFSSETLSEDVDVVVNAARAVARNRRLCWSATADLQQQTLFRVVEVCEAFDADLAENRSSLLFAWSRMIAQREHNRELRKKRPKSCSDWSRHLDLFEAVDDREVMRFDGIHASEWVEEIAKVARKLPPAMKRAFDRLVCELNDMPVSDGELESTIRSRKSRMLEILRRLLSDESDEAA
jgi:hypothetical protein